MDNQEYRDLQKFFDGEFQRVLETNELVKIAERTDITVGGVALIILIVSWYFLPWYYAFLIFFIAGMFTHWVLVMDIKEPSIKAASEFLECALKSNPTLERTIALENWGSKFDFPNVDIAEVFQGQITERVETLTKDAPDEAKKVREALRGVHKGGLAALTSVKMEEQKELPELPASAFKNTRSTSTNEKQETKTEALGLDGTPIPLGRLNGTVTPSIPIYGNRAAITLELTRGGLKININTVHMGLLEDEPRKYVYLIPYHGIARIERSDQIVSSIVSAVFQPLTGTENRGYKLTTHIPFNIYSRSSNNVTYWLSVDVDGETNFAPYEWLCKQPWPAHPMCPTCNRASLEVADDTGFLESMSSDKIKVSGTCTQCQKKFAFNYKTGIFS